MEIIPGIHRIHNIRGANSYLVTSNGDTFIVDTGLPGNTKKIADYIEKTGKNISDIKFIVITHADIDHIGSAAELKKLTGARLAIHAGDAAILQGKQRFRPVRGPLGFILNRFMALIRFRPVEPDIIVDGKSEIAGFKIVTTPGHTMGSICLYKPGKVIFVGDTIRTTAGGNPKPGQRTMSFDFKLAGESLISISTLDFAVLLPGHGPPLLSNASQRVREMVMNMRERA